jgi:hypothetical protein
MKKMFTNISLIKITLLFLSFSILNFQSKAATFRTLVGIQYDTPTTPQDRFWINSDTAFGETSGVEISYVPSGGGSPVFLKFLGAFDNMNFPGANWKVDVTYPAGATNLQYQLFTRNQSGSDYGFTGFVADASLPVQLSAFSVNPDRKVVNVSWSTAQEINNKQFEVERSKDLIDWISVGSVEGRGTTKLAQNYEFTDRSPDKGINYYRLKQIDSDGTFTYTRVKSAVIELNPDLALMPNPATEYLRIGGIAEPCNVEILDARGQVVLEKRITSSTDLGLNKLVKGVYFVRITDSISTKVSKILVEK